jgi:hypothetical protein
MLFSNIDHPCNGATVCGQTFHPADDDCVYAVFDLKNCSCGVAVEKGRMHPWMRLAPGVQIPQGARKGFERYQFECDDDAMVDLKVDLKDGEVSLRCDLDDLEPETVARALEPLLAWVDDVAYPAVVAYLERQYR